MPPPTNSWERRRTSPVGCLEPNPRTGTSRSPVRPSHPAGQAGSPTHRVRAAGTSVADSARRPIPAQTGGTWHATCGRVLPEAPVDLGRGACRVPLRRLDAYGDDTPACLPRCVQLMTAEAAVARKG